MAKRFSDLDEDLQYSLAESLYDDMIATDPDYTIAQAFDDLLSEDAEYIESEEADLNGDGDSDITVTDDDSDNSIDEVITNTDSPSEEAAAKDAVDKIAEKDTTSTGKSKKELDDDTQVSTLSDGNLKNIVRAIYDVSRF